MAGEKQPIAVRTIDYLKQFSLETTGINAGRQASEDHKIVDVKDGKVSLDIKGSAVFVAHNIFPLATRVAQHPEYRDSSVAGADLFITPATLITAGAVAAALNAGAVEAVGILAGINTAKNAAIVLIPDVLHSIVNASRNVDNKLLSPHFKRRPDLSNNGTK